MATSQSPMSALGGDSAAPIPVVTNSVAAPTMPAIPAPAPEPSGPRMPEPATGEHSQPQEVLGRTSPPAVRPAKGKQGFEKHAVRSAQEMLGLRETPKKELDRMAKALREGTKSEHDIELKDAPKAKAPAVPAKPKEEEAAPEEHPEPSPIAKAPEIAPETKVKIGDKEYTPKELEARMKELEEKATKPIPDKPADQAQPEKKPEEIEAERSEDRKSYIENEAKNFKPEDYGLELTQEKLDTILAGEKDAIPALMEVLAKVAVGAELRVMSRLEKELNPILADYHNQLSPVSKREKEISAWEHEQKFLESNSDLKPLVERVREKAAEFNRTADFCEKAITAGIATPEQIEYAKTVRGYSPEEFDAEVARHVRETRDKYQSSASTSNPAAAPNPTPQPAAPKAPAPRPKPPVGQVPNTPAPVGKSGDSTLNGILASGRM